MRSSRLLTPLLLLVPAAIGCSDSGGKPDALILVADAKPDAPPLPPGCDFQELRDDSNDAFDAIGSAEDSGLTFTASTTLCGKANSNHFEPATMADTLGIVDIDSFKVTLSADATIFVTLSGAGLESLRGNLRIYGGQEFDENRLFGEMHAGHTSSTVRLLAGTYEFDALFLDDVAATSDISYKIKIVPDVINTRCAELTTGGFAEASDGAQNTNNDMIKWNYDDDQAVPPEVGLISFTPATTDAPENTAITTAPGMSYRMTGNSANNPVGDQATDDYKDHDTFEFKTDATTNEITIRLKFPSPTADIDVAMGPKPVAGDTEPNLMDIANNIGVGPTEMVLTSAVEPNTTYWFWVGGYKVYPTSATAVAPATASTYEATMCAKAFAP